MIERESLHLFHDGKEHVVEARMAQITANASDDSNLKRVLFQNIKMGGGIWIDHVWMDVSPERLRRLLDITDNRPASYRLACPVQVYLYRKGNGRHSFGLRLCGEFTLASTQSRSKRRELRRLEK